MLLLHPEKSGIWVAIRATKKENVFEGLFLQPFSLDN
jgi:hypothetical protein